MGKEKKNRSHELTKTNLPPALEISPFLVRSQTIRLVNQALSESFPDFFRQVKPLRNEIDVIVVRDRSSIDYYRSEMVRKVHSLRLDLLDNLSKEDPKAVTQFSSKEAEPFNVTDRDIPGNPILILDSEITDVKNGNFPEEYKRALLELGIGRVLAHEGAHHYVKEIKDIPVDPSDPLFRMTFSFDRMQARSNQRFTPIIEELERFASANNPSVKINATKISLYCDDINGERKAITGSGYDLEESIVELITHRASNILIKYAEGSFSPGVATTFKNLFDNSFKSMDHYRMVNLTSVGLRYLSMLGIRTLEEAVDPFMSGEIPLLHSRLLGK